MAIAPGLDRELSPEELLSTVQDGRFELIDGELKEKVPMGAEANLVTLDLLHLLRDHVRPGRLGRVFGIETGFQIFPHERRRVRYPDGAFVRAEKFPDRKPPRGLVKVAPELVIEVISPNDVAEDVDARLMDFLRAGVPLLWVVYPLTRHVVVFRGDGGGAWINPDGVLSGEDVLPGFTCPLPDLFAAIDADAGPDGAGTPEPSA